MAGIFNHVADKFLVYFPVAEVFFLPQAVYDRKRRCESEVEKSRTDNERVCRIEIRVEFINLIVDEGNTFHLIIAEIHCPGIVSGIPGEFAQLFHGPSHATVVVVPLVGRAPGCRVNHLTENFNLGNCPSHRTVKACVHVAEHKFLLRLVHSVDSGCEGANDEPVAYVGNLVVDVLHALKTYRGVLRAYFVDLVVFARRLQQHTPLALSGCLRLYNNIIVSGPEGEVE